MARKFIGTFLAEALLRDYYEDSPRRRKRMGELREFCASMILTDGAAKKTAMRFMRLEANRIAVGALLSTLTMEQQTVSRLLYKEHRSLQSCSFRVGLSVSQLSNWRKVILLSVLDFVSYRLNDRDIFRPEKIINMMELIARTIKFTEEIDPSHSIVDRTWLSHLCFLYSRYSRILESVVDCVNHEDYSLQNKILAMKIRHPSDLDATIAKMCHVDTSTFSRYLRSARTDIMQKVASYS